MNLTRLILPLLLVCTTCIAQPPKTKEEFLAAVRTAFETKDVKRIHELTWENGVSEFDRKQADQVMPMMLMDMNGIESVSFEPLPPGFFEPSVAFGRRMEPTHPADGIVKIVQKPKVRGSSSSMRMPYAVISGGYYRIAQKTTDLGWKGPRDSTLNVMVMGPGQEKVKTLVKYNASGVESERNSSGCFPGQYIREVTVLSESDDVDVTMSLVDPKGDAYYRSEPLKGKGRIHYKKGDAGVPAK